MIVGIGIDVVDVQRVGELLKGHGKRFTSKIFTDAELRDCPPGPGQVKRLAARFAAKEAFFKAIGKGLSGGIRWKDAEVVRNEGKGPTLRLCGKAEEISHDLGVSKTHLSLSHTDTLATAYVVLEK
ncbi:MAG: holo-ACP synthase [Candidatus Glassbacteria bacterium]